MALTKADISKMIVKELNINVQEAKSIVDSFFDEIKLALESGESVKISGFGNFNLRDKVARPGRNPKTGEPYEIKARRVVTFHASGKLKEKVSQLLEDKK